MVPKVVKVQTVSTAGERVVMNMKHLQLLLGLADEMNSGRRTCEHGHLSVI
jgi:hypothetical protein